MTIEQEIQYAIRAALQAKLTAAELTTVSVHAQKLDAVDDEESEETYPVIVVSTNTPKPAGHKSQILDVDGWITIMSYLPDDRKKDIFSEMAEVVFRAVHDTDDWEALLPDDSVANISAISIESGEEPGVDDFIMSQTTNVLIHAFY
jgi:hypothetical protein